MMYVTYFANKKNSPTSFTQMAWARSSKIGCGIGDCGTSTVVVCRYREKGNIIDQSVWQVGNPCSACIYGCSSASPYLCANSP
ncbi:hypothetical protein OESDEN_18875 [Oesophagostomum dentatum]|uniref:SCP domain-containing protein n=1 Tax=Oesophagostomum dentatum TaxID=61180 RepID=A0A0B1S924_OESDE|nr:hypothetical protein OESDEN_18875 [Oesophagostomum dentatum]